MPEIKNTKVTKVKDRKPGAKGRWVGLQIEGSDLWFSLFMYKEKPAPTLGTQIKYLQYEEETSDEGYTNNNIKKIEWGAAPAPGQEQAAGGSKQSPLWFVVSYMKDLQMARIEHGAIEATTPLVDIGLEVAEAALAVLAYIEKPKG